MASLPCIYPPQQLGDPPDIRVSSTVGDIDVFILPYTHSLSDGVPLPPKWSWRLEEKEAVKVNKTRLARHYL